MTVRLLALAVTLALVAACRPDFDPTAVARAAEGRVANVEASVPPMCYTKTGSASNPCWVCHTIGVEPNLKVDLELQRSYAFSEAAKENHWTNLFADRREAVSRISDDEILAWIRDDNYAPLRRALASVAGYPGWIPDLDLDAGFDADGFARDGSGWRAVRYKPFPGGFWPTNGSTGDLFIRLPLAFRVDDDGRPSRAVYEANLATLEATICASQSVTAAPAQYGGRARTERVVRRSFPRGTELLHSVRYLDPDAATSMSRRMKELRYMRKVDALDDWANMRAYEREADEKEEGNVPVFPGSAVVGYRNAFGWQLQGFIEDAEGRLRLQTEEEHRFCMGCHGGIGVTVDSTFAFARKVPGADGWRTQDLRGMKDVPQVGHGEPEALEYMRRVGGADELRANTEMLARFFPDGRLDEPAVRRAAPGGDADLAWLLGPTRERALMLDKAYRVLVRSQRFDLGRDSNVAPIDNVHRSVDNGETELAASEHIVSGGRLHLQW